MPKNMGKGGKSFKAGNAKSNMQNEKRELLYAEEGEEYAQVKRPLGNLRLELQLVDGSKALGAIRGAMVRKVWIAQGDVVLVSKRAFNENDLLDIIYRYQPHEARQLVKDGVIPRDFRSAEELQANNAHSDYIFVAENDEDDEENDDKHRDSKAIDRNKVVLDDPLANFDDL